MKWILLIVAGLLLSPFAKAQDAEMDCAHRRILHNEAIAATMGIPEQNVYDVGFVKLDLALTNVSNFISGSAEIWANATGSLSNCALELHDNLVVDSAYFNGAKRTFTQSAGVLKVFAPSTINIGENFKVKVFYHGNPPNGGFFNGFSNGTSGTWGNKVTWSLSEPNNAFHWWPCKQVLTDKLDSSKIWITVDSNLKAGSNGVLENITKIGAKKRFEWNYPHPIAYYLLSVAVASYVDYSFNVSIPGIAKPVLVQNYIYDNPNTLNTFKSEIDKTGDMLKVFSKLYGPYPFANMKYGHCMAPFSGGMEHNTMTSQGSFNTTLTAHELAHQWWGDNVTCKSWKDIWVNEAFARYSEYVYLKSYSEPLARTKLDDLNKSALSGPAGSVYVTDTLNANVIFNGRLTYDKGSLVVHMLRFELDDDTMFFKILRAFQNQFKDGNAGVSEFKKIAENFSGKNFTTFFNQWYYGQGHPTFDVYFNNEKGHCILKIKQSSSAPGFTPLFETPVQIKLIGSPKDTLVKVFVNAAENTFQIPYSGIVVNAEVDPNQWILNDTGKVFADTSLHFIFNGVQEWNHLVKIYPVPTERFLYITDIKTNANYRIYSMVGAMVATGRFTGNEPIDVSGLKEGNYLICLGDQNYRFTKK